MRVLFTGSSSFTGYWFIRELVSAGHEVVATFRGGAERSGVAGERICVTRTLCRTVFDCPFGSESFLRLIEEGPGWDVLCHHGAEVGDYKSPSFAVLPAVETNTFNIERVLGALGRAGCNRFVVSGTIFEPDEGANGEPSDAVSPYGLSKGLTWQIARYRCHVASFHIGKFVLPNPFGPYEEQRFTSWLVKQWYAGQVPKVLTPDYVRDNVHVDLLAKAYARFTQSLPREGGTSYLRPSGYVEPQGDFARRFASELAPRLGLACELELATQTEFPEPRSRHNCDALDPRAHGWDEKAAWDRLAGYYRSAFGPRA